MKTLIENKTPKYWARMAGIFYLLIAFAGGFSIAYVPSELIIEGDALATAQQFANKDILLRMGLLGDISVMLMEIVITVILYRLLRQVNQLWALMAAFSRFAMAFVMSINLLNLLIPAYLFAGGSALEGYSIEELNSLAMIFLEMHALGIYIWGLFFGFHLIFLGYLVYKSRYFPRWLGALMFAGSFGYILEALAELVMPEVSILAYIFIPLLTIVTIGELSFTFYLLIKGLKVENWEGYR